MALRLPIQRRHWLYLVGVLLVCNPLYIDALHIDDPGVDQYEYRSYSVTFTESHVDTNASPVYPIDRDVACLDGNHRTCRLEHHVKESGGIEHPEQYAGGTALGYGYAYLDGEFYRATPVTSTDGNGTLSLEYVPRSKALSWIATRIYYTDPAIQKAIQQGQVAVDHELMGAGELISYNGEYYVVQKTATHNDRTSVVEKASRTLLEDLLIIGGVVAGVHLFRTGRRRSR